MPGSIAQQLWKRCGWPPFDALAGPADVFHFPNFVVPPLRRGRAVVTIHDVSFLRYPQFAEERNRSYLAARIPETVRRADAVITDSRFCASEIVERLGADPARVFAVPLGIGADFVAPPRPVRAECLSRLLGTDRPYLLTVGTVEPRKNLAFLVEVFETLRGYDGDWVLAGMRGWKCGPIFERIARSNCAHRIRYLEYVDNRDLPALYAGADLFMTASFYEGFGFPPLEAMACGTPVVSSRGGALPEVLGDAALYVDGFDAGAWTEAIVGLLADSDRRASRGALGKARAAGFRWETTAAATWDVYRRVAA
jgi:glycosyltransferase involved in cell wall biosynthesis